MKFNNQLVSEIFAKVRESLCEVETPLPQLSELVLNISEGCNLTCDYCFANEGLYSAESPSWMSEEHAYQYTLQILEDQPTLSRIKLFGGEPFMNIPALTGFVKALEEYTMKHPHRRDEISVGCVTNLTIYSPRIVDLIKRARIRVTASIDGPQDIHDTNRRFRNGKGSFARICAVADRYKDVGVVIDGVECVYSTIHQRSGLTMIGLHDYIVSVFNPRRVILTPLQAAFPDSDDRQVAFSGWIRETSLEYLRECVRRKEEHVSYRAVVEDQLAVLFGPKSSHGWCALGASTCTITADGNVLPCYTLLNKKENWSMGKMRKGSFVPSERRSAILRELQTARPMLSENCVGCEIREVCRGCPGAVYSQKEVLTGYDLVSCNFRMGSLEGLIEGWKNAEFTSVR